MGILSEILRVVRLSGVIHIRAEFTRPWAVLSPAADQLPSRLAPGAETVIPFHIATAGKCLVLCRDVPLITLEAGDVVVFARGDQHVLASEPGLTPVPVQDIHMPPSGGVAFVRHGGGGARSEFVCGYLHSDQRFSPLLDALPAMLCVRVRNGAIVMQGFTLTGRAAEPVTIEEDPRLWQAGLDHIAGEAARPGTGDCAVLGRLSELLFVKVVRWQLAHARTGHGGWLAGLNDPHVGRALALLHAEPARTWTVEDLAQHVAISRSALAQRFVEVIGETPMQYLAEWRMHLARRLLAESNLALAEIANRTGYDSGVAFNRAFRRMVGVPPGAWRLARVPPKPARAQSKRIVRCAGPRQPGTTL